MEGERAGGDRHRDGSHAEPGIERSRVNLTEVGWGGVRVDGIPSLEHAPYVLPEEATYLLPDDRVFGVSINGEHRAYHCA